jgi:hypothetical protein
MSVSIQVASLIGTLDRQLSLIRDLSSELVACRTAYVAMDLDAIYQHIATQTALCDQIRQIDEDRKIAWSAACASVGLDSHIGDLRSLVARLDPAVGAAMRDVVTKLALAEGDLRHLNRAHTVLIDGSRRTLAILTNVLASFAPTYARPESAIESQAVSTEGAP